MLHRKAFDRRSTAPPTQTALAALKAKLDALVARIEPLLDEFNNSYNFDWSEFEASRAEFDAYIEGAIELQKAMAPIPAEVSKLRDEAYAIHAAAESAVADAEALNEAAADLENDSDYLETLEAEISDIDDIVEALTKRRDEVAPA